VHVKDDTGSWDATDFDWDRHPRYWPGGHGLYSTPRDYLRFQRTLLGGGSLSGTTILDSSTVTEMFTNQIGDLWFPAEIRTADPASSCDFVAGPGMKWGYGLLLNPRPQPGRRHAGSGAWAGMFNTYFWIDRSARLTGAVYTQCSPFVTPSALRVYDDVERALYATRLTRPNEDTE
jgi:CubicO group peptidase (beta-lactamase class C family)